MSYLGLINITGLLLETVGIYLFTRDVLTAVTEAMQRIEQVASMRPVEFGADTLIMSDDVPEGQPTITLLGAQMAIPAERNAAPMLLRKRRELIIGATFLGLGIVFQLAGQLWQLFNPA